MGPICTKNGSLLATLKMENNFFGRNNKSRSSGFWNFLFYQNIILFGWVMNLFLSWMMFFVKKVSFPAKKDVDIHSLPKITLGSRKHGNSVHSDSQNVSEPKEYPTSRAFNGARRNYTVNLRHPSSLAHFWLLRLRSNLYEMRLLTKITQNFKKAKDASDKIIRYQRFVPSSKTFRLEEVKSWRYWPRYDYYGLAVLFQK